MKINARYIKNKYSTKYNQVMENDISILSQSDDIVDEFLFKTRRILLIGEIDEIASTYICSYLQLLSLEKKPIYFYINSPGGCLSAGYAIIDQMSMCDCPIYTIVRGQAHSMGAIIAAFGDIGNRYSTINSSFMLHSVIVDTPRDQLEKHTSMFKYIEKDYDEKLKELSKRLKLKKNQLQTLMSEGRWMSYKEAIKIGLIDKLWTKKMENNIVKGLLS